LQFYRTHLFAFAHFKSPGNIRGYSYFAPAGAKQAESLQANNQQSTAIFTILCVANSERFPLIRGNVEDKRVKKTNLYIIITPVIPGLTRNLNPNHKRSQITMLIIYSRRER
jgi:hypothetical protein